MEKGIKMVKVKVKVKVKSECCHPNSRQCLLCPNTNNALAVGLLSGMKGKTTFIIVIHTNNSQGKFLIGINYIDAQHVFQSLTI